MKTLKYMIMMLLLIVAFQAAGQTYVIDRVCSGAQRHYRIDGEAGSRYMWQLTDSLGNPVSLTNQAGTGFTTTDPNTGQVRVGSEIIIPWTTPGTYKLTAVQYSALGCDTLQQGEVLVFAQPAESAGNPMVQCTGSPVRITGASATNYSTLMWSSSGDGVFNNPLALNPTYTPGPNDQQSRKEHHDEKRGSSVPGANGWLAASDARQQQRHQQPHTVAAQAIGCSAVDG